MLYSENKNNCETILTDEMLEDSINFISSQIECFESLVDIYSYSYKKKSKPMIILSHIIIIVCQLALAFRFAQEGAYMLAILYLAFATFFIYLISNHLISIKKDKAYVKKLEGDIVELKYNIIQIENILKDRELIRR